MSINWDNIFLIGSVLLLLSIFASKTTGRAGVPSLLIFLAIGMLAGSDGIGGIHFDDPKPAQALGIITLVFILFSGGLETKFESVKPVLWQGVLLSTVGVFLTALTVGFFITLVSDFTLLEGLLIGSIISSTDAAAVFSILRSKSIGLKGNLRPLLELESGSNDPMAYLLTISFTSMLVSQDAEQSSLLIFFLKQIIFGTVAGILFGFLMYLIINKIKLEYDGLYPVLILALVMLNYGLTTYINGNGFLAVYISAIILGNKNFIHKKSIMRFYDGQAWLMQIVMFLTLGLLVFPKQMVPYIIPGLFIALFLMFMARPLAVFLCLSFFKMKNRERLLISWVGLRGAVPIVFATYPWIAGVEKSNIIFNIVFFIVITSVLFQGTTIPLIAKALYLFKPVKFNTKYPLELELSDQFKNELFEIEIPDSSAVIGKQILELSLPKSALVVMINRNGKYLIPKGNSVLESGDRLLVMTDKKEDRQQIETHVA